MREISPLFIYNDKKLIRNLLRNAPELDPVLSWLGEFSRGELKLLIGQIKILCAFIPALGPKGAAELIYRLNECGYDPLDIFQERGGGV